jgi:quercetin dioxygenase-like cupin family protein
MRRGRIAVAGAACATAVGLAAGAALATPGANISATILGSGTAEDKVKTRGNQPYDVVVQSITIAPGGHTGWHTHPGMAVVVVNSGTLTIYDGKDRSCSPQEIAARKVYIDPGYGHVHIGRNEGTTPTEILVTYLDVPVGGGVRIDADDPGHCPF